MRVFLVYEQPMLQCQDLKQTNKTPQISPKTIVKSLKAYKFISFPKGREGAV